MTYAGLSKPRQGSTARKCNAVHGNKKAALSRANAGHVFSPSRPSTRKKAHKRSRRGEHVSLARAKKPSSAVRGRPPSPARCPESLDGSSFRGGEAGLAQGRRGYPREDARRVRALPPLLDADRRPEGPVREQALQPAGGQAQHRGGGQGLLPDLLVLAGQQPQ